MLWVVRVAQLVCGRCLSLLINLNVLSFVLRLVFFAFMDFVLLPEIFEWQDNLFVVFLHYFHLFSVLSFSVLKNKFPEKTMASHTEIRASLSSIGDSAPSSDLSESIGSDCYQRNIDWPQTSAHMSDLHKDNSNFNVDLQTPSDSTNGILSDAERAQIESFFNSLGTEVSSMIEWPLFYRREKYAWCTRNYSLFSERVLKWKLWNRDAWAMTHSRRMSSPVERMWNVCFVRNRFETSDDSENRNCLSILNDSTMISFWECVHRKITF